MSTLSAVRWCKGAWLFVPLLVVALATAIVAGAEERAVPSTASALMAQSGVAGPASLELDAKPSDGAKVGEGAEGAPEPEVELTPEEAAYLDDLQALVRHPHRLSGSSAGKQAAQYLEERLRALGFKDIAVLDMPVFYAKTWSAQLRLGDAKIPIYPLRPNVTVLPVTPEEGIDGKLFYVGRGRATDYGERQVEGSIVVLDYDCADEWSRAFALGARAVVFLGVGGETTLQPKHLGIPANFPRFYVSEAALEGIDIKQDWPKAEIESKITWERSLGRNIVVRVPGTAADFSPDRAEPEALVLAAHYDSFGVVPELSRGARAAANVASLVEAGKRLLRAPPKRDVLLFFLDNQARYHQGAREVYDALLMSDAPSTCASTSVDASAIS